MDPPPPKIRIIMCYHIVVLYKTITLYRVREMGCRKWFLYTVGYILSKSQLCKNVSIYKHLNYHYYICCCSEKKRACKCTSISHCTKAESRSTLITKSSDSSHVRTRTQYPNEPFPICLMYSKRKQRLITSP